MLVKHKLLPFLGVNITIHNTSIKILINKDLVNPTSTIKNLGMIMDNKLQFNKHINSLIKRSYLMLKQLYGSSYILDANTKLRICQSLILSIFNYGDIIYGPCITSNDKRRIQVAQNSCVRFVTGIKKGQHISAARRDIGWLDMESNRLLHSLCLYHKIIINGTPSYLRNRVKYRLEMHNVNIRHSKTLSIPKHNKQLFKRSFSYQIAFCYNKVSNVQKSKLLKQFRTLIKQDLFNKSLK